MGTQSLFTDDNSTVRIGEWLQSFRASGFPYPDPLTHTEKIIEFKRLKEVNFDNLMDGGTIKQAMEGNDLAWSYFPHRWEIKCNSMLTPMEVFQDDEKLRKVLQKCLNFNEKITPAVLRHWLTKFSGTQVVSNFRPTAAAAIYRYFLKANASTSASLFEQASKPTGVVWDMSCGFGGRLLGALASGVVGTYVGTDPSTPTFDGLQKLAADFVPRCYTNVNLNKMGSEVFRPQKESLDLCFTSPPYFDCEKYTGEETQSYVKFSTQSAWLNSFMAATLENCLHGLKPDGRIAINIAPVKSYPTVCDDLLALASRMNLELDEVLQLSLRKIPGSHNSTDKGNHTCFKYEPVYVLRKK